MILVLIVIYIAFIALGLPDSLFGTAWPLMHTEFGVAEGFASIYTIICSSGTAITSFFTGKLIRKFGTGLVTFVSVMLTAVGLIGISFAPSLWAMIPFSIIMGIGAGAVDSGLNNFVSLHYKPWHMSWLHCFWGVGVTVSPLIMAYFLKDSNWRGGYSTVGIIQFCIVAIILISLPLWKNIEKRDTVKMSDLSVKVPSENNCEIQATNDETDIINNDTTEADSAVSCEKPKDLGVFSIIKSRGVFLAMLALGLYCAMEFTLGLWGASYLINTNTVETAAKAATWVSLYFGGIMVGRFITGFLTMKFSDNALILGGVVFAVFGGLFLLIPNTAIAPVGLVLIGIGFGPIFPCSIHATSKRFGIKYSADITGFQMFFAYFMAFIIQTSFGFIASATTFKLLPYLLFILSILLFITELFLRKITANSSAHIEQ